MLCNDKPHDDDPMPRLFPGVPTPLERQLEALGATGDRYRIQYCRVPMRDGICLATVVVRPRVPGAVPAVLERTPYTRFQLTESLYRRVFRAGWAVVLQNERGTGWSEGDYGLLYKACEDGADTLTWIASQPWSNGRVALVGCSSPAENQLRLAAVGHPALKAVVPMSAGAGVGNVPGCEGTQGLFYKGGIPLLGLWAEWYYPAAVLHRPRLPPYGDPADDERVLRAFGITTGGRDDPEYRRALDRALRRPPSATVLTRLGVPATPFDTFIRAEPADPAWDAVDLIHEVHTRATPALHINGWLDIGAYETVRLFAFQQHHPDQYLIMTASAHCAMIRDAAARASLGDRPVGNTVFPYDEVIMAWLTRWIAGDDAAWRPRPRVQMFLMGGNQWLTGDHWPLPETEPMVWFLGSRGHAETLWGDGWLKPVPPPADSPPDVLLSDPHNPVPSLGFALGNAPVCTDQRPVEARQDVLVYTTAPLSEGVALVGEITAVVYVSADVPDADLFVKLVDVYPDGTAYNVAWSALRLRYRNGYRQPQPLTPGMIYPVRITGMATANYFAPGHRIRLEIAGSQFPLADRNWHTGGLNALETDGPLAHCHIYHDADHPARLECRRYIGPLTGHGGPEP